MKKDKKFIIFNKEVIMKKIIFGLIMTAIVVYCASAAGIREEKIMQEANTGAKMDLIGHEWKLIGVYIDGVDTQYRREIQPKEIIICFTLNFDGQIVSGVGAPNRYSAPYTIGENQNISIMMVRSTLMASLFEPYNLTEHDFFTYIQNSHSWRVLNGQLELNSKTADNKNVRLVFN